MLHAHEGDGVVAERDAELAAHLRVCHSREQGENCQHWHFHLVLWGEVQSDSSDSKSPPPRPLLKHLEVEFAVPTSDGEIVRATSTVDAGGWDGGMVESTGCVTTLWVEPDAVTRIQLFSFQHRVAASRDVACLLMVARC